MLFRKFYEHLFLDFSLSSNYAWAYSLNFPILFQRIMKNSWFRKANLEVCLPISWKISLKVCRLIHFFFEIADFQPEIA